MSIIQSIRHKRELSQKGDLRANFEIIFYSVFGLWLVWMVISLIRTSL